MVLAARARAQQRPCARCTSSCSCSRRNMTPSSTCSHAVDRRVARACVCERAFPLLCVCVRACVRVCAGIQCERVCTCACARSCLFTCACVLVCVRVCVRSDEQAGWQAHQHGRAVDCGDKLPPTDLDAELDAYMMGSAAPAEASCRIMHTCAQFRSCYKSMLCAANDRSLLNAW